MKNKKYIVCSGLAFADTSDMELLHRYAKQGWVFKELKFSIIYCLHKEEPQDLVFDYDIQKVNKEDKDEYLSTFQSAGWELIGKWNKDIHFFLAPGGTTHLHSEHQTRSEQFRNSYWISMIVCLIGIVLLWIGVRQDIFVLYPIAGACVGGGGTLWIASKSRVRGKPIDRNPRSYPYQILKLMIGFAFLISTAFIGYHSFYTLLPLLVGIWFVIGSIYSFYKIKKERELYD